MPVKVPLTNHLISQDEENYSDELEKLEEEIEKESLKSINI